MKNSNGRDSAVGPAPPLSTRGKMDGALLMISDDAVALGNWFRTTICCKRSSHVAAAAVGPSCEVWKVHPRGLGASPLLVFSCLLCLFRFRT